MMPVYVTHTHTPTVTFGRWLWICCLFNYRVVADMPWIRMSVWDVFKETWLTVSFRILSLLQQIFYNRPIWFACHFALNGNQELSKASEHCIWQNKKANSKCMWKTFGQRFTPSLFILTDNPGTPNIENRKSSLHVNTDQHNS